MSRISSREEALFADALALPPAERGSFLAKACGADVDQLAHLVALVAAHEGPETLLNGSHLRQGFGGQAAPSREVMPDEKPGDVIGLPAVASAKVGHYKLLQKIGEGAVPSEATVGDHIGR
jgi:hypothetical protein